MTLGYRGQASGNGKLPTETVDAVQQALGAEHAAVWVYGLVSAFLSDSLTSAVNEGITSHRARRDATERLLASAGVTPKPAEPAYITPKPVTNQSSALALLVTAETDTSVAWRAVLDRTDDQNLRRTALDGLTNAAVRLVRWRKSAGMNPAATAMPGQPA